MEEQETYGLGKISCTDEIAAPELNYKPRVPKTYNPGIAVIGCGGISEQHFLAYSKTGFRIVAVCDIDEEKAIAARDTYFPEARVFTDWKKLINEDSVEIVDLTVHPHIREAMFFPFIDSGKHILSQKPFVTDISKGEEIVRRAKKAGVKLAVNQNGRWSPHYSYINELIKGDYLGDIQAVRHSVSWDHSWTKGSVFEEIHYLILYDFGIHWFDIMACYMKGRKAKSVFAMASMGTGQDVKPPLISSVLIEFEGGQASVDFNAHTRFGQEDRTIVVGTKGTAISSGMDLTSQSVGYYSEKGLARPKLEGSWFPDGFAGTMGELLCAIEEDREPSNNASDNLYSLRLCFAGLKSAGTGLAVDPWEEGLVLDK